MSEQDDKEVTMVDRVYQSMSRQLRCGNPAFTSVTYCPPSAETDHLTEHYLAFVATAVSARLASDKHNVTVRYAPAPQPPHEHLFIGTIYEKIAS